MKKRGNDVLRNKETAGAILSKERVTMLSSLLKRFTGFEGHWRATLNVRSSSSTNETTKEQTKLRLRNRNSSKEVFLAQLLERGAERGALG